MPEVHELKPAPMTAEEASHIEQEETEAREFLRAPDDGGLFHKEDGTVAWMFPGG